MGIDIYMNWDGLTAKDKDAQITGFVDAGEAGYLRGAYFGGLSDVLYELFDWMDWENQPEEGTPFNPVAFEEKLILLKAQNGQRPDSGKWKHLENAEGGWDGAHKRQEELIRDETFAQYDAFLELGRHLIEKGKNPKVIISY